MTNPLGLSRGDHADEREHGTVNKAEGAEWLAKIEADNADEMTPERMAALEAAAADGNGDAEVPVRIRLDEEHSPTAGRRFTRT